ncbi:MAG: nucleoside triphosphate pyrophosphohydrolase [Candidatus Acidiferrales bacterium]
MAGKPTFEDLVAVMARLRAPGGCPWDREQTHRSLRTYLLEETYEVLDAIERDDPQALRDELGDLLLQILFHAQMAGEQGRFSIEDVVRGLHEKLIRRHPHVFGTAQADSAEQVVANWEALKAAERQAHSPVPSQDKSALSGVPATFPALLEAYQVSRRAAQVGFEWERFEDLLEKLDEEVEELNRARLSSDKEWLEDEVGDLLFVAVNIARYLGYDPEPALRRTNRRFRARFAQVEAELAKTDRRPQDATPTELNDLWELVKSREAD